MARGQRRARRPAPFATLNGLQREPPIIAPDTTDWQDYKRSATEPKAVYGASARGRFSFPCGARKVLQEKSTDAAETRYQPAHRHGCI